MNVFYEWKCQHTSSDFCFTTCYASSCHLNWQHYIHLTQGGGGALLICGGLGIRGSIYSQWALRNGHSGCIGLPGSGWQNSKTKLLFISFHVHLNLLEAALRRGGPRCVCDQAGRWVKGAAEQCFHWLIRFQHNVKPQNKPHESLDKKQPIRYPLITSKSLKQFNKWL